MRPPQVAISWISRKRPISDREARRVARAALRHGRRPAAPLSIVFLDDRALARLHGIWLDDDSPTDVITFDLSGAGGGPVGELYVSVQRAESEARRRGIRVRRELALYIAHGCLHLCGYDDRTARQRRSMRGAERSVLRALGYEDDPSAFE